MRSNARVSLAAAALTLSAACLAERELLPPSELDAKLQLGLNIELDRAAAAGERMVDIQARYRRADGDQPTLPVQPARVTLQDGETIQQSVIVDIGPCNADPTREPNEDGAPGCRFAMELTLRNGAGDVLGNDEEMIGPVGQGPPPAPTFVFTAPTLALSPPSVTFSARSQQQSLPAAQNVTVGVDVPGASLGTLVATVTFNSGQNWLRATVDQGAHAIVVQPTTTALETGTYAADVTVTSSVDGVNPRTVAVSYQIQPQPVLTVAGGPGDGTGTITSSPAAIDCTITSGTASGTCAATFTPGAVVSLTPTPAGGSRFAGWGGACSGSSGCSVTMDQPATVTARFNALPVLTIAAAGGGGSGTVTSSPPGIDCGIKGGQLTGPTCSAAFNPGAVVELTATPLGTDRFGAWGGPCGGSGACSVTMSQAATVTARFDPPPAVLSLSPRSLSFSGVAGSQTLPPRQTVTASNTGGGTLGAITIANISYGSTASGWLDATVSGSTISVGANPANVTAGNHTATVTVRSANGGSATFTASFAVTNPPPRLGLTPNVLSFSTTVSTSPAAKTVRASNIGFGTFADLGPLSAGTGTSSWLKIGFDGDIVVVAPSVSSFAVGTYAGTAVINSVRGGSATVAVTLTVNPIIIR